MKRRVVITGLGVVGPVGNNVEAFWENIKKGANGIGQITRFDTTPHKACMGAEVKDFEFFNYREGKRLDLSSQYAIVATKEAMNDSGLEAGVNIDPYRLGVIMGTGIGGISTVEKEVGKALEKGVSRVSPLMVPMTIPNIISGNVSIFSGAKGASMGLATACASGTHSLGEAFRTIRHGYLDAMIVGGTEASFAEVSFAGFANMTALSTRKDSNRCSTPFDKERDGFVMGEGSGVLILEELEHAWARGAKIYAEVVGYGATSDAYHVTMPSPEGEGAAKAMEMAINDAGIKPEQVSYINAHGTGTPYNDLFETKAIKTVFEEAAYRIPVSSSKSMIGHLLGAAGAVEALICTKALEDDFIPPTINLEVPDEELDLDYVPKEGRKQKLDYVLSNSLGFGGHNGTILLKKWEE